MKPLGDYYDPCEAGSHWATSRHQDDDDDARRVYDSFHAELYGHLERTGQTLAIRVLRASLVEMDLNCDFPAHKYATLRRRFTRLEDCAGIRILAALERAARDYYDQHISLLRDGLID